MRSGNIAIVSHVNPFSSGSGQVQRVYNSLLAIAADWEHVTLYTLEKNSSNPERLQEVLAINISVQVIYLTYPESLPLLKPLFHFLPNLGFGKPSNWILPYIFNQLNKDIFSKYHCVLFEYWHLYKLAAKIKSTNTKVVCDTHNILLGSFKEYIAAKKWAPQLYKKFLISRYANLEFKQALSKSFDALIAINKEEEAIFKSEFPNKKIIYTPMGIKLPEFIPHQNLQKPSNTYTIVYYGGLGNPRNATAALEVYRAIFESTHFNDFVVTYKIIGSNPPKQLTDLSASNPRVSVVGYVENLADALSGADLAVIPFEGKFGFRSRLIELMYYGIPVLTTDDAVWGMGLTAGSNIFIYKQGENLDEKIIELLNNNSERNRIAGNAKTLVAQEFTFEATYTKLSQELKNLVNDTRSIFS